MTAFLVGFWIGAAIVGGGVWLGTHPADRRALLSKVRALFGRQDSP